jgi:transposase
MARTARGRELLDEAKMCVSKAKTVEELRQAQAMLLPLEYGLSLEQTAEAIGVSKGWACQLRTQFIRNGGRRPEPKPARGGRRRENMSLEEEAIFLRPFFEKAATGGILIVSEIKQSLYARLGRKVALASVYNLLHRHGWRKIAPDKRHVKADVDAQEAWKKNSHKSFPRSPKSGLPSEQ